MARQEIVTCDRCGHIPAPTDHWSEAVIGVVVKSPPDGINHGVYTPDLCASCRRQLDNMMREFLRSPKDSRPKTEGARL